PAAAAEARRADGPALRCVLRVGARAELGARFGGAGTADPELARQGHLDGGLAALGLEDEQAEEALHRLHGGAGALGVEGEGDALVVDDPGVPVELVDV